MRNLINNEIKAISGGKGLVGSLIGLAVSAGSKKIISEVKKNLQAQPGSIQSKPLIIKKK